jgi:hypothetical protein
MAIDCPTPSLPGAISPDRARPSLTSASPPPADHAWRDLLTGTVVAEAPRHRTLRHPPTWLEPPAGSGRL